MKKSVFLLLMAGFVPVILKAEWVPLDSRTATGSAPQVTLLKDDAKSTVIKVDVSGIEVSEMTANGRSYQLVDLLTESFTNDPGNPQLPYVAKVLAIPDQAGISVEVIETGQLVTFKDVNLPPARPSWWEGDPEPAFKEDPVSYRSENVFPSELVRLDPPAVFRDFRVARVSVFPARYIAAKKELQVYSSITVRISYGPGEVINAKTTARKPIPPSFGKIYRNFIFNYDEKLKTLYGGREEGRDLILCIMPDIFAESFQVYADWKRQSGTDVHLTKFSDIGANASNPDIIKNHIADAYHNWEYPPTYVLLVGDDGICPKKIVVYPDYSFPNEDYFVEIDGNDYFPEMMIGRFTNEAEYRMQVMINKLMMYEKEPYMQDASWLKKGTCCSNNAYPSQPETKRFAYHKMMDEGNFIAVDTLMSDGGYGGDCTVDLQDVIAAINSGRGFLNYRGEGWYDGWHANCYYFSVSDVAALNNTFKFPFVTSIGCGVAAFNASGGNCFGEEWMEMGSMAAPRGAAAFLGPTSNTHTAFNNEIDKGIYIGMFDEGLETPGQALLRGKLHMYSVFGNVYYVEYHFKIYCCLGDPSIHIWKTIPQNVNADFPPTIPVGVSEIEIKVKTMFLAPVQNAVVCVTADDVFATGITDSNGIAVLTISSSVEEMLTLTVRGGNVIPFQDTIETFQYDVYIEPLGDPVIDDLDGNNDGLINPNENCNVTYTLANWGVETAYNVKAVLTTEDSDYVEIITTDTLNFGNINPSQSSTGSPFRIYIKPDCPVGQNFTLKLHVTCDTNSWDYANEENVKGCRIGVDNFVISDPCAAPDMNFRLDPGETDVVVLSVINSGEDQAFNLKGILRSDDPFITITDSTGSFGTLDIGDVARNMENVFMVSVSPSCPTGYMAGFTLKAYTQNGNYPYQELIDFTIPVSKLIPTDYTGPDEYGYYAYSSDDSFYDQTPVFDWVELEGTGTQIVLPQVSDYTTSIILPFNFKYYGVSYNQLRISTDGWIAFGSGTQVNPNNAPLPHPDNVNNMVGVFWDDLYDTEMFMGSILYYNDVQNHRFIVEWDSISRNTISSDIKQEFFEAILLDPAHYPTATGDGEIIVQYRQLEDAVSNTIGIENYTQSIGLNYVCDNVYDPTASVLANGTAIKFTTEPPLANILTGIGDDGERPVNKKPGDRFMVQNHPNPFTSSTQIDYSLPEQNRVVLAIYDISGELVRKLFDGRQAPGSHSIDWNGLNDAGMRVTPGIYFCHLQTDDCSRTIKMCLIR